MNLDQRVKVFSQLGKILCSYSVDQEWPGYKLGLSKEEYDRFNKIIKKAKQHNGWFDEYNVRHAVASLGEMLREDKMIQWLSNYSVNSQKSKTVAVIMAGNIPLVGFHDFLCVLMAGHRIQIKLSSEDQLLLPALIEIILKLSPDFKPFIQIANKLENFDAVIATGSNNSAMYFESYFSKYPHIIRKNRTSIAIINDEEHPDELKELAKDIFQFYGLGCRNVTKVYVPEDYNLDKLFGALYHWKHVTDNNKYANNYDYNKAVYLMNRTELIENGFLLVKEDQSLHSPLAVLFYERYKDENQLREQLQKKQEEIQCIVSLSDIPFGQAQQPSLTDYADGVDTMAFLTAL